MKKSPGFIKAALIIIVAVAILAASGISVRDNLNPEQIASTTEQVAERGENFYTRHVEVPLHTIIITPATIVWEYIEEYGVGSVESWLETILSVNTI